jgi:hypothetical protein
MNSGNLNFLEPSGRLQACNGTALPYYLARISSRYPLFRSCASQRCISTLTLVTSSSWCCHKSWRSVPTRVPQTIVRARSQVVNIPLIQKRRVFAICDVSPNYDRHYTDLHSSAMEVARTPTAPLSSCGSPPLILAMTQTDQHRPLIPYCSRVFPFNYFVHNIHNLLFFSRVSKSSKNYLAHMYKTNANCSAAAHHKLLVT